MAKVMEGSTSAGIYNIGIDAGTLEEGHDDSRTPAIYTMLKRKQ